MFTESEKIVLGEVDTHEDVDVLNSLEAAVKTVVQKWPVKQPVTKQTVMNYAVNEVGASPRRKALLERLAQIPGAEGTAIRASLLKGTSQVADTILYSVVPATDKDITLIKTDTPIRIGVNSFDNAKHDKFALIHGVYLRYSTGTTEISELFNAPLPAGIVNGELTIKVNTKDVVSKMPIEKIASFGLMKNDQPFNYIELENPKWIIPNKTIEAEIKGVSNLNAGFVKIGFACLVIIPA